jgi:hypothetical protein
LLSVVFFSAIVVDLSLTLLFLEFIRQPENENMKIIKRKDKRI